jgi:hypothetical protein
MIGGHSSAGRAPDLHSGGRRFDPVWLHHCLWVGMRGWFWREWLRAGFWRARIFDIVKREFIRFEGRLPLTQSPARRLVHRMDLASKSFDARASELVFLDWVLAFCDAGIDHENNQVS